MSTIEFFHSIFVSSRRSQILYSGGDSTTTKDGATVFEVSPSPPLTHSLFISQNNSDIDTFYNNIYMQHDQSQCKNDDRLKMSEERKRAVQPTTPTTPTSKALPEATIQRDSGETKEEKEAIIAPATKK